MDMNKAVANSIDAADQRAQYDACCKQLLSFKEILSFILCSVADEFAGMDRREAEKYIENDPTIGDGYVDANMPEQIRGEQNENTTISDGDRRFDILFQATVPNTDEKLQLVINIEVQNNYNPGYSLLKRGIYYCSRLISRQYGTEFTKSDYNKIKKVYSIWICTNSPKEYANTVISYDFQRRIKHGKPAEATKADRKEYDLISLNMICIGNEDSEDYSDIIEFLGTLLSNKLPKDIKKEKLTDKFGMEMTEKIDEEVENMCNLSYTIDQSGFKRGFDRGEAHGFERGEARAKREVILALKDKMSNSEIAHIVKLPIDEVDKIMSENQ